MYHKVIEWGRRITGDILPESRFKEAMRSLLRRYVPSNVVLDNELVRDIMEYFNLSRNECVQMLKLGCKLNACFWNTLHPKNTEEIESFYRLTPFYIFDLAYWHMQISQKRFRDKIIKIASGDVLDYGGGIGDLCIKLAEKGLKVTYADVSGATFEFAKWLFKKMDYDIEIMDIRQKDIWKQYDTIICLDVMEQRIPDRQALLEGMAMSIKEGGRLIITKLHGSEDAEVYPMHQKIGFNPEELLNSCGLFKTDDEWLWVKTNALIENSESHQAEKACTCKT